MKKIVISLILTMNFAFAGDDIDGTKIPQYFAAALVQADLELDAETLVAWSSEVEGDELEVKFLNTQGLKVSYGCHVHEGEDEIECHEEGDVVSTGQEQEKDEEMTLEEMQEIHAKAMEKVIKRITREGSSESEITATKLWLHEDSDSDHDHGVNIWTKVNYNLNGTAKTRWVVCHEHGHSHSFSPVLRNSDEVKCHWSAEQNVEGEPEL